MEKKVLKEYWWKAKSLSYESSLPSKNFVFQFVFFTTESLPCSETQPSK